MFYSHWLFDEQLDSNHVFFLHRHLEKKCMQIKSMQEGVLPISKVVVRYS